MPERFSEWLSQPTSPDVMGVAHPSLEWLPTILRINVSARTPTKTELVDGFPVNTGRASTTSGPCKACPHRHALQQGKKHLDVCQTQTGPGPLTGDTWPKIQEISTNVPYRRARIEPRPGTGASSQWINNPLHNTVEQHIMTASHMTAYSRISRREMARHSADVSPRRRTHCVGARLGISLRMGFSHLLKKSTIPRQSLLS